jgi:hypothetical protein
MKGCTEGKKWKMDRNKMVELNSSTSSISSSGDRQNIMFRRQKLP